MHYFGFGKTFNIFVKSFGNDNVLLILEASCVTSVNKSPKKSKKPTSNLNLVFNLWYNIYQEQ